MIAFYQLALSAGLISWALWAGVSLTKIECNESAYLKYLAKN
jgi:hypothetical protein